MEVKYDVEVKEAIKRIKEHNRIHFAQEYPFTIKITEALDIAIKSLENQDKIRADLKYYLDTNEENGVVYIPKFVIERIINNG